MPCDFLLLPHAGIQTLAPYVPGKSAEALAKEQGLTDIIKMASNENPLGCSPLVTKALASMSAKQIATYPISAHHPLCSKIATFLGVDAEMITLSNGSDLLYPLLINCFALHQGKHILVHDYAFIVYSIFAKTQGVPVVSTPLQAHWRVDIDAMIAACNEKTALIFLANPNNPTGARIPQTEIIRLLDHIPTCTIVVLDEAYYEFKVSLAENDSLALLAKYPNLVITRTFSKAYGLAGLRIGYAIAQPDISQILLKVLPSFTVSQAALVAAEAALDDQAFIQQTIELNQQGLQQLKAGIKQLELDYLPTEGNFITIDCRQDGGPIYQRLQRFGLIVRPLHAYGLNNFLRVSVGTPAQNTRFLNALPTCLSTKE